jgi:Rap1a immunity proteins
LGVFDQMALSRLICPPDNSTGLTAQAVAVALKFLNDHPERWALHPVFLIGESLKAAFPCGG